MTDTSPKLEGAMATFRQVDDIEWTVVQQQRNADGTVSSVREKWPIIRPDFLSAYVHYEAGMVVRRHGHRSNHIVFVLGGGAWIGGEWSTAGMHVHVPLGAAFGPIVAGPFGVTCWELSFGEFGGWGDQQELYENEIRTRGVTPLPDPPIEIGDWFKDPRGDWGNRTSLAQGSGPEGSPDIDGRHRVDRGQAPAERRWLDLRGTREMADRGARLHVRVHRVRPGDDHPSSRALRPSSGLRHRRRAWFGDRWCPAGTHIELPFGAAFGPIIAGDEATVFLELTDGDFRSWGDQPELFDQAVADRGVTPLPDPPIEFGEWFDDARGYWAPQAQPASS